MAKYIIHSCNDRQWYVDNYLVPSLIKSGISKDNISICQDKDNKGCLESYMQSFLNLDDVGGTWHLQDDVVISSDFKEQTEKHDVGIVCALCTGYDKNENYGTFNTVAEMWYSFPCIRIPNAIAKGCAKWFYDKAIHEPKYRAWINRKKYADVMFRRYLELFEPGIEALNLYPNIVNHIDFLLGGSTINKNRSTDTMSRYWADDNIITQLENRLKNEANCSKVN